MSSSSRYLSSLGLSDPNDPIASLMHEHMDDRDDDDRGGGDEKEDANAHTTPTKRTTTPSHTLPASLAATHPSVPSHPLAGPSSVLGSPQPAPLPSAPQPALPLVAQPRIITIVPQIQNLVCSISLGVDVDPKAVAMRARNAEYNPKRFAACILRLREPKTTALLFRTGKLICAGARSVSSAQLACHKYTRLLQRLHYPAATCSGFAVINLVATVNTRFPIRLEALAHEHGEWCSYEPELFPGLVYRVEQPKCVVLCFVSGKCVVTGARCMDDVKRCVEFIFPILRQYSKRAVAMDGDTSGGAGVGGVSGQEGSGG